MNNILFGIIGALMLAIVGIGGVSAYDSFAVEKKPAEDSAATKSQNVQGDSAPVVSNTTARADDDNDDDDKGEEEDDDERSTGTVVRPAQTSTDASSGATSPASTAGTYTMAQVKQHNSASSCYTAVNGSVYDVTSWIKQHPGGAQAILSLCGTDGSAAFSGQHSGQARPASELASFKIGVLAK